MAGARPRGRKQTSRSDGRARGATRGARKKLSSRGSSAALTSSARQDRAGTVRLNKYLADHGIASRRACDQLIVEGKVTVDGEPVTELGSKVDPAVQTVEIDGVILRPEGAQGRYYLLNKPSGVVCTNERRETRPRAIDLITDKAKGRIYTVGRLDEDSKGLILLTNDGDFAQRVAHPRFGVPKTYHVKLKGKIDDDSVQKIRNGVHLSYGKTGGARVLVRRRTPQSSSLLVTLREGKNREVRRVFARVGFKVLELKRTEIGPLSIRGLTNGRWRVLTRAEVEAVLDASSSEQGPIEDAPGTARPAAGARPGRGGTARRTTPERPRPGKPGKPGEPGEPGGRRARKPGAKPPRTSASGSSGGRKRGTKRGQGR